MSPALSCALLAALVSSALGSPTPASTVSTARVPILLSNDDGWADANIRAMYDKVKAAGFPVLLAAPAVDMSTTGSSSEDVAALQDPGEFGSIPVGAPGVGHDAQDDHIWYVNGYPADAINYALSNLTAQYLGGSPALVLAGPNVGRNLGVQDFISGTLGAATAAARGGIPAIAYSGWSGTHRSYTGLQAGDYSHIYADAALTLARALIAPGTPYLPEGVVLNVNFPPVGPGSRCKAAADFKYVLARAHYNFMSTNDACTCGTCLLPTETNVVEADGCFASVTPLNTAHKLTANKLQQSAVLLQLKDILTCMPAAATEGRKRGQGRHHDHHHHDS